MVVGINGLGYVFLASTYLFKFSNGNSRIRGDICSKLAIKTSEQCVTYLVQVPLLFPCCFIEHIQHNRRCINLYSWAKYFTKNKIIYDWIRPENSGICFGVTFYCSHQKLFLELRLGTSHLTLRFS